MSEQTIQDGTQPVEPQPSPDLESRVIRQVRDLSHTLTPRICSYLEEIHDEETDPVGVKISAFDPDTASPAEITGDIVRKIGVFPMSDGGEMIAPIVDPGGPSPAIAIDVLWDRPSGWKNQQDIIVKIETTRSEKNLLGGNFLTLRYPDGLDSPDTVSLEHNGTDLDLLVFLENVKIKSGDFVSPYISVDISRDKTGVKYGVPDQYRSRELELLNHVLEYDALPLADDLAADKFHVRLTGSRQSGPMYPRIIPVPGK